MINEAIKRHPRCQGTVRDQHMIPSSSVSVSGWRYPTTDEHGLSFACSISNLASSPHSSQRATESTTSTCGKTPAESLADDWTLDFLWQRQQTVQQSEQILQSIVRPMTCKFGRNDCFTCNKMLPKHLLLLHVLSSAMCRWISRSFQTCSLDPDEKIHPPKILFKTLHG